MKKSNMEELEKMFMVSHPDARPAFPLRKLNLMAAVAELLIAVLCFFVTFSNGLSKLLDTPSAPAFIILGIAFAAAIVFFVYMFRILKKYKMQGEDELAREIRLKSNSMASGTMFFLGWVLFVVMTCIDITFTIHRQQVPTIIFMLFFLKSGLQSLFYVILDKPVIGDDDE